MSQFQEYVTGQAFALTLSRRMCEALEFVKANQFDPGAYRSMSTIPAMSTLHALLERGLVERCEKGWRLSEAGMLLFPLLEHAGLVVEIKAAPRRTA